MLLTHVLALSADHLFSKKKPLRVCALVGENWPHEIDFSRHEDNLRTKPPGTPDPILKAIYCSLQKRALCSYSNSAGFGWLRGTHLCVIPNAPMVENAAGRHFQRKRSKIKTRTRKEEKKKRPLGQNKKMREKRPGQSVNAPSLSKWTA